MEKSTAKYGSFRWGHRWKNKCGLVFFLHGIGWPEVDHVSVWQTNHNLRGWWWLKIYWKNRCVAKTWSSLPLCFHHWKVEITDIQNGRRISLMAWDPGDPGSYQSMALGLSNNTKLVPQFSLFNSTIIKTSNRCGKKISQDPQEQHGFNPGICFRNPKKSKPCGCGDSPGVFVTHQESTKLPTQPQAMALKNPSWILRWCAHWNLHLYPCVPFFSVVSIWCFPKKYRAGRDTPLNIIRVLRSGFRSDPYLGIPSFVGNLPVIPIINH